MRSFIAGTSFDPTSIFSGICNKQRCSSPFHIQRSLHCDSPATRQSIRFMEGFRFGTGIEESNQLSISLPRIIKRRCLFSYKGKFIFGFPFKYKIEFIWVFKDGDDNENQFAKE